MGVAGTGHMFRYRKKLMHGGRWYRPHDLQKFNMGVAGTGHMFEYRKKLMHGGRWYRPHDLQKFNMHSLAFAPYR